MMLVEMTVILQSGVCVCQHYTSFLAVVVRGVELSVVIGQLNAGDDQVVLLVGSVRAQNQTVHAEILPLGSRGKNQNRHGSIAVDAV